MPEITDSEFVKALESVGAKNVSLEVQRDPEQNDSLYFELGDKCFMINSHRGGRILKGSYMELITASTDIQKEGNGK